MTHSTDKTRSINARRLADASNGIGDPSLVLAVQARIAAIKKLDQYGRRRRYAMKVQQKIDRALESYVRINYTAWSPQEDQADDERDKFNAEVKRLIKAAADGEGDPALVDLVRLTNESRTVWDNMRDSTEKDMVTIARGLHVAPWIEAIHGIGLLGLALIIAETGSFDTYANPQKIWSRLGFAPFDGHAGSTWKRDSWRPRALTADEWIAHPFSGSRYAAMHVLANWLVNHQWISAKKAGGDEGKPNGRYGEVYAARRIRTGVTHPDWTDGHRRKDALRIAFKRFLADLWEAWVDLSFDLGQRMIDAPTRNAEIAAADHAPRDAHSDRVGGGTKNLGPKWYDAQGRRAEIAAADQRESDAHLMTVSGGTKSKRRGPKIHDAPTKAAATAAADRGTVDIQRSNVSGGTKRRART